MKASKYDYDQENLGFLFIVSSTPPFLFKSFKADESVQLLKNTVKTLDLIEEFNNLTINKELDFYEVVYAYALYVAILLKEDSESFDFVNTDKTSYHFFPCLREYYLEHLSK